MSQNRVCTNCGHVGQEMTFTKGSFIMEVVLWLFFLVPGLIYSIWRLSSRTKGCPSCGKPNMVPVNSPVGKKMVEG